MLAHGVTPKCRNCRWPEACCGKVHVALVPVCGSKHHVDECNCVDVETAIDLGAALGEETFGAMSSGGMLTIRLIR